jgi:quercetin dioxygenase-like cupin family protein
VLLILAPPEENQLTKEYNMFTRRGFVLGAVYSTMTLASSSGRADAQGGPETLHKIPLKILRRTEYPGEKYACVLVEVDLAPGELVPRHMHPGVESTYLASGTMMLSVQGQSDRMVKAGEGYQIPPDTPHNIRNGPDRSKIVSTLIVEKDKPMVILVPSKEFSNAN